MTDGGVDAQAAQVAGDAAAQDGFERAVAAGDDPAGKAEEEQAPEAAAAEPQGARSPSEGTLMEMNRRAEEQRALDSVVDRMAKSSPRAAQLIGDFQRAGGTFTTSNAGGWFKDGGSPVIGVPAGTDARRMQSIAHELGHFDYRGTIGSNYAPPGTPMGLTDHQIEMAREHDYIVNNTNRHLADEGNATLVNQQIQAELRAAGINIGVSGEPFPSTAGMTPDQARAVLGDFYGSRLTTSVDGQNYRSYYGQTYIDDYARRFLPGHP